VSQPTFHHFFWDAALEPVEKNISKKVFHLTNLNVMHDISHSISFMFSSRFTCSSFTTINVYFVFYVCVLLLSSAASSRIFQIVFCLSFEFDLPIKWGIFKIRHALISSWGWLYHNGFIRSFTKFEWDAYWFNKRIICLFAVIPK